MNRSVSTSRDRNLETHIKDHFPLLSADEDLVYLDNAATTQKPEAVLTTLDRYYRETNANIHRGLYGLAERSTAAFEDARRTVARFIGARDPKEIIFTRGATEALNLLAWSLTELLVNEGDRILLSTQEHHANLVPWQQAAKRRGARLCFLPTRDDGLLDLTVLNELDDLSVKIAAVAQVSNAFGTVHPVHELSAWCRERGIPFVVDAAQSLPHMGADVQSLGADFLAFSGHKIYGPMGSGVLWGAESWLERLPPWQTGGEMIHSVRLEDASWNEIPHKFEAGTPDVAAAVGLAAAMDWIDGIGFDRIVEHERLLEDYALKELSRLDGLILYGPQNPEKRRAVFSFNLERLHSHDVAQFLDRRNVAIRSGHHCAQPAMQSLNIPSTARASLAVYNNHGDIDRLISALNDSKAYFS